MTEHKIGRLFVELDLDPSRYMRGQQTLLKEAQSGATVLEKNFRNLKITSGATFDLMRAQAIQSFEAIKRSGKATADDLVRAERAKADRIKQINKEQFGYQATSIDQLKNHWKGAAVAMAAAMATAAAAIYGITRIIKDSIAASNEQEVAIKRLDAVLRATGGAAGYNTAQLVDMATAMQKTTTVGDEVILSGMSMLATFKKVRGEGFERAMTAALDLSEVMQQDLKSSVVQVGKALNDPILGMSALSRVGVQFTEDQKKLAKQFVETGQIAKAQGIIFEELEGQMGGAAKAARDTFAGAVKAAGNAIGDTKEAIGEIITKNEAFIELMKQVESFADQLTTAINDNKQALLELAREGLVGLVSGIETSVLAIGFLVEGMRNITATWLALKRAWLSIEELSAKSQMWAAQLNPETYKKKREELAAVQQAIVDVKNAQAALDERNENTNEIVFKVANALAGLKKKLAEITVGNEKATESSINLAGALGTVSENSKITEERLKFQREVFDTLYKTVDEEIKKRLMNEAELESKAYGDRLDALDIFHGDALERLKAVHKKYIDVLKEGLKKQLKVISDEVKKIAAQIKEDADTEGIISEAIINEEYLIYQLMQEIEAGITQSIDGINKANAKASSEMEKLWTKGLNRVQEAFADTFYDAMTGELDDLGDLFDSFFKDILRMVAEFAAKMMMYDLFGIGTQGFFSDKAGGGGFIGSLLGSGGGGSGGGNVLSNLLSVGSSGYELLSGESFMTTVGNWLGIGASASFASAGALGASAGAIGSASIYGSMYAGMTAAEISAMMEGVGVAAGAVGTAAGSVSAAMSSIAAAAPYAAIAIAAVAAFGMIMSNQNKPDARGYMGMSVGMTEEPGRLFEVSDVGITAEGFDEAGAKKEIERISGAVSGTLEMYETMWMYLSEESQAVLKKAVEEVDWENMEFHFFTIAREGAPFYSYIELLGEAAEKWIEDQKAWMIEDPTTVYENGGVTDRARSNTFSGTGALHELLSGLYEQFVEEALEGVRESEVFRIMGDDIQASINSLDLELFLTNIEEFNRRFTENADNIRKATFIWESFNGFITRAAEEMNEYQQAMQVAQMQVGAYKAKIEELGGTMTEEDITAKTKGYFEALIDGIDNLGATAKPLTDIEVITTTVNAQFDAYLTMLAQVGVDITKITDLEEKRAQAIQTQIDILETAQQQALDEAKIGMGLGGDIIAARIQAIMDVAFQQLGLSSADEITSWFQDVSLTELKSISEELEMPITDIVAAIQYLVDNVEGAVQAIVEAAYSLADVQNLQLSLSDRYAQLTMPEQDYQSMMLIREWESVIAQIQEMYDLELMSELEFLAMLQLANDVYSLELEAIQKMTSAASSMSTAATSFSSGIGQWESLYNTLSGTTEDIAMSWQNPEWTNVEEMIPGMWSEYQGKLADIINPMLSTAPGHKLTELLNNMGMLTLGAEGYSIDPEKITQFTPEMWQLFMQELQATLPADEISQVINELYPMLLEILRAGQEAYDRPSQEYQDLYNVVMTQLEMMEDIAGWQAGILGAPDWANQQIALQTTQVDLLTGIYDVLSSQIPSYQGGTDYVPSTGLYNLHQGEQVIPANVSVATPSGPMNLSLNITVNESKDAKGTAREVRNEIERFLISGVGRKIVQNVSRGLN